MQHEVRDLLQRVSATAIDLTQLSSRRQYTFEGGTVTSPVSGVSHTLYKKLDEDESNETEGIHVKIEEDDEPERAESPQWISSVLITPVSINLSPSLKFI